MMKDFENFVSNLKGCKIATLVYQTTIKVPQKYGLGGVATKRTKIQVQLNYSYANAVNNRLEKQGDERAYETQSMSWGDWVVPNLIKEYKGNRYLRAYLMKGHKGETQYFVNGLSATQEQIEIIQSYERSKYHQNGTQASLGLVENQVKPKDFKYESILELRVDNQSVSPQKFQKVG